jgi:type III secretion system low calcium response chaperone LcrH/SycD
MNFLGNLTEQQLMGGISKLSLNAESAENFYAIALNLYENGKYPEALNFFRLLTIASMENGKYWFGLAASQQMLGAYSEATPAYLAAARLDHGNPYPFLHQAECFIALKCFQEALQALDEARGRAQKMGSLGQEALTRIEALRTAWKNGAKNDLSKYNVNHSKV